MLRFKLLTVVIVLILSHHASAQELFVYSEPASNMPAKSVGIRLSNWLTNDEPAARINYQLLPEIMLGINKRLMLHAEGYFDDRTGTFLAHGAGIYAKYRFYSRDKVYRHFRLAAFGRAAVNNAKIFQEQIETNGYNTGYQLGFIGTQLLHKTALSATVYYQQAFDNTARNVLPAAYARNALNYSFSAGRLLLPKVYTGYKQVNLNFMTEILGQTLLENGRQFIDIAPSFQLIFNSQTRVDIGYKHQLYSNMQRIMPDGLLLRVEHLLYNII